ncbi:MAG TPA: SH3 domain-containing protein [Pseudolabrys sp.]|nr:SH3 domain-containing protein [Pseudolabrys sp.]
MKKQTIIMGTILAMAAAAPTAALARAGFATTDVHMRAGPSTNFPIITTVNGGARVHIHGCLQSYNWCDVSWQGDRGWIYGRYLQFAYNNRRVLVPLYGARVNLPVVSFSVDTYWRLHYRHRGFYSRRHYWHERYRHHHHHERRYEHNDHHAHHRYHGRHEHHGHYRRYGHHEHHHHHVRHAHHAHHNAYRRHHNGGVHYGVVFQGAQEQHGHHAHHEQHGHHARHGHNEHHDHHGRHEHHAGHDHHGPHDRHGHNEHHDRHANGGMTVHVGPGGVSVH